MDETSMRIISTVISTVIASGVAILVAIHGRRSEERKGIRDMISRMIELTMTYPHVESRRFLDNWPNVKNSTEEERIQYENYCCFVFNLLERIWEYSTNDPSYDGISPIACDLLHVEEVIHTHQRWWTDDRQNSVGYTDAFQRYVDSTIDKSNKKEER